MSFIEMHTSGKTVLVNLDNITHIKEKEGRSCVSFNCDLHDLYVDESMKTVDKLIGLRFKANV